MLILARNVLVEVGRLGDNELEKRGAIEKCIHSCTCLFFSFTVNSAFSYLHISS